jgi:hypothetical protein
MIATFFPGRSLILEAFEVIWGGPGGGPQPRTSFRKMQPPPRRKPPPPGRPIFEYKHPLLPPLGSPMHQVSFCVVVMGVPAPKLN